MKLARLREVRELRGWSQSKLAKESDVSRDGISNYETGRREAWPATAKRVADALGVEISDLIPEKPGSVGELVGAGKGEAPPSGRLPEWARTSDLNVLNRSVAEISSEELRDVAMRLAAGVELHRTLEDALNETRDEMISRTLNLARIDALGYEFKRRGEEPPEKFVLVYREWKMALTPPDAKSQPETSHEVSEAG